MNGQVTEGKLYDTAIVTVAIHGLELENMEWYETSSSMKIDYHRNFWTKGISLSIYGLPYDIPTDVFEDFLDIMIKTRIEGDSNAKLKKGTTNWLNHYRRTVLS